MDTTIDQFYEVHKNYLKNHFIPYPIDRKFDSIKDACSTTLYVLQQELFLEEKMKLNTKSKNSIILRKKKAESIMLIDNLTDVNERKSIAKDTRDLELYRDDCLYDLIEVHKQEYIKYKKPKKFTAINAVSDIIDDL